MKILRTTSENKDFIALVKQLDADLSIRDGEDHAFYDQFNKIDMLKNVVVCYLEEIPVGCGAFKPFEKDAVEIKRMYTLPKQRGKGFASAILNELETWAKELGFTAAVLETGIKQPEAIALYEKNTYKRIKNYGQYAGIENSLCFKKNLK
ncbi:MAG: GNAT family N-acetyltransferase [Flavobacteriaceae bacterium]